MLLFPVNKNGAMHTQSLISPNAFLFQKNRLNGVCTVCLGHFGRQLAYEILEHMRYVRCFYHSSSTCPVEIWCYLSTVTASHLTGHMSHSDNIQSIASFSQNQVVKWTCSNRISLLTCLFVLMLYVPVNNFSAMSLLVPVFMG